jgi:transcriptional regulator with XRE-family HTH domain
MGVHDMSYIGLRIKEIRKSQNMTQDQLAEGICTRSYISSIEKGKVSPSIPLMEKLAARLHVSVDDFRCDIPNLTSKEISGRLNTLIEQIEEKHVDSAKSLIEKLSVVRMEDTAHQALLFWARGKIAEFQKDFRSAESLLQEAVSLSRQVDDVPTRVRILDSIGTFYSRFENNPRKGSVYLNEAFELMRNHDITGRQKINVLISIANMSFRFSEYVSAIRYFKEVYDTQKAYSTQYRLEDTYMGLGIGYMISNLYEEAHYYLSQAIRILEEKGNDDILLYSNIGNLGILYRDMGDYAASEDYLRRASNGFRQVNFRYGYENNTIELALTYKAGGKITEAKSLVTEIAMNGLEGTAAEAKFILSEILLEENKVDEAYQTAISALDGVINQPLNKPLLNTYLKLGQLFMERGEHQKAAYLFQKSSEMFVSVKR